MNNHCQEKNRFSKENRWILAHYGNPSASTGPTSGKNQLITKDLSRIVKKESVHIRETRGKLAFFSLPGSWKNR